jgi:hypothetical protein
MPTLRTADQAFLRNQLRKGNVVLFTGAGFSSGAKDLRGRAIPLLGDLRMELWNLCFGRTCAEKDASLGDLYQCALNRSPGKLRQLLDARLRVNPATLPRYYERWFAQPWEKIFTLNIDTLNQAANEAFALPRPIVPISAVSPRRRRPRPDALQAVHLNGMVGDPVARLTFSWPQYGERLAREDVFYAEVARAWLGRPLVFVGTRLEEPAFWQQFHRCLSAVPPRSRHPQPSFIVTPRLTRPRRHLLEQFGVRWIPLTARRFASEHLTASPESFLPIRDRGGDPG